MQGVPIYQASGLATKALSVYQAYIEMMNEDIRTAFDQVRPASCSAAQQPMPNAVVPYMPLGPQLLYGSKSCRMPHHEGAHSSACRACV